MAIWHRKTRKPRSQADAPPADPTSLGHLAVAFGFVKPHDIDRARDYLYQRQDEHLGKALGELGLITEADLDDILHKQQILRCTGKTRSIAVLAEARKAIDQTKSLEFEPVNRLMLQVAKQ